MNSTSRSSLTHVLMNFTIEFKRKEEYPMQEIEMSIPDFIKALRKANQMKVTPMGLSSDEMHAFYAVFMKIASDAGLSPAEIEK